MKGPVWDPIRWSAPVAQVSGRIRLGDAVRNPAYEARQNGASTSELHRAYALCEALDAALASRGLRIDYPACHIGFVVRADP